MTESKTTKHSAEAATQKRQQKSITSVETKSRLLAALRRQMASEGVTVGKEADGRVYIMKHQESNAGVVKAAIKHRHQLVEHG